MTKLSAQRLLVICAITIGLSQPVCAQTGSTPSDPPAVSPAAPPAVLPSVTASTVGGGLFPLAERSRIDQERGRVETIFAQSQATCYQKFAVEGCQTEARAVRREALADLRRQEVSLNAAQARLQGAEQLSRIDSKASTRAELDRAAQRAVAEEKLQARLASANEKLATRAAADQGSGILAPDGRATGPEKKAQTQADLAAKARADALAQKKYDARIKQAQLKAAQRRKRLSE